MKFVEDVIDLGAHEVAVTGLAEVERIDADQVRITYYICRKGEKSVATHLVFGRTAFLGSLHLLEQIRESIVQELAKAWNADADASRKEMH